MKSSITIGDKIAIQRPYKSIKLTVDSDGLQKGELDAGDASDETMKAGIERVVISVGGKTDKLYDAVMGMDQDDGQFVLDEIDKIISGKDFMKADATPAGGIASAN